MSKKPETPRNDGPAGTDSEMQPIPAGRRYTKNPELLRLERELREDGKDLANQAIPSQFHPEERDYNSKEEIRDLIEKETENEYPNQSLIGVLNQQLSAIGDGGE